VIIGGLNWGIVGLGYYLGSSWNGINFIFGSLPWFENLIYLLVGVSALVLIFKSKKKYHAANTSMDGEMK
jgi:uncharacterized membrane protein YuzA (DUF378 family)